VYLADNVRFMCIWGVRWGWREPVENMEKSCRGWLVGIWVWWAGLYHIYAQGNVESVEKSGRVGCGLEECERLYHSYHIGYYGGAVLRNLIIDIIYGYDVNIFLLYIICDIGKSAGHILNRRNKYVLSQYLFRRFRVCVYFLVIRFDTCAPKQITKKYTRAHLHIAAAMYARTGKF